MEMLTLAWIIVELFPRVDGWDGMVQLLCACEFFAKTADQWRRRG
jgi:hypothetical protein